MSFRLASRDVPCALFVRGMGSRDNHITKFEHDLLPWIPEKVGVVVNYAERSDEFALPYDESEIALAEHPAGLPVLYHTAVEDLVRTIMELVETYGHLLVFGFSVGSYLVQKSIHAVPPGTRKRVEFVCAGHFLFNRDLEALPKVTDAHITILIGDEELEWPERGREGSYAGTKLNFKNYDSVFPFATKWVAGSAGHDVSDYAYSMWRGQVQRVVDV